MSWLASSLQRFWFTPAPASRLGMLRIIVGMFQMYMLIIGHHAYRRVARTSHDRFEPVGFSAILDSPISPALYDAALWLTMAVGVCFVVGLWYRVMGPLFAILVMCVVSYRLSWGMVYRVHHLLGLHVLILGLVPAAKALSLDAWMRGRSRWKWAQWGRWPGAPDGPHWRYAWPIQLMCVVTTIVYGLAGMAKILGPAGWQWADGQNLRNHVAYDTLAKHLMTSSEGSDWVPFLFEIDGAMMAMAWIALIVELCAPLFLVNRRLSQLWVFLAIGMHWGIRILMGLTFAYQTFGFAFLSFFAIERVLKLWPETWPGRVATE